MERTIGEKTAPIERAAHQAILRRLDVDAPKVMIDGGSWSRPAGHEATYDTMAGRWRSRAVGRPARRRAQRHRRRPVSLRAGVAA
ncbi:MAG: hypothetical protein HS111_12375 [Kofleriaceae bacterium]|nr:hypothetical protein [Kofleriaceae bacterium]